MKRHISLYFGSITFKYVAYGIAALLSAPFIKRKRATWYLTKTIRKRFGNDTAVYAFGSARSAIAFFLSVVKEVQKATQPNVGLSAYTCLAVPTGVLAAGCKPIYMDTEGVTLNVNPENINDESVRDINIYIVQHTLGSVFDISKIRPDPSGETKKILLEDCALSIGTQFQGKEVGSVGDASVYSMELSKTISIGWGGVLIVNNKVLASVADEMYKKIPWASVMSEISALLQTCFLGMMYNPALYHLGGKYFIYYGYKYNFFKVSTPGHEHDGKVSDSFLRKLSTLQLLMANYQWKTLDSVAKVIHKNFTSLKDHLQALQFRVLGEFYATQRVVAPRISFLVKDRNNFIKFFEAYDIEAGMWFDGPLTPQPSNKVFNYDNKQFPSATAVACHVVNLPCHSRISDSDVNKIKQVLTKFKHEYSYEVIWQ